MQAVNLKGGGSRVVFSASEENLMRRAQRLVAMSSMGFTDVSKANSATQASVALGTFLDEIGIDEDEDEVEDADEAELGAPVGTAA